MGAHLKGAPSLVAFTLEKSVVDWQMLLCEELRAIDYQVINAKTHLICHRFGWQDSVKGQAFIDAFALNKVWASNGNINVGIVPRRAYVSKDGEIDTRQEWVILGSQKRPASDRFLTLKRLKELSSDILSLKHVQGPLRTKALHLSADAAQLTEVRYANKPSTSLPLIFVAENHQCKSALKDYAEKLSSLLSARGLVFSPKFVDKSKLKARLRELTAQEIRPLNPPPVLLMLSSKTTATDRNLTELFGLLDALEIPWRRAYVDDDRRWSVRDQLGSIMRAAGLESARIKLRNMPLPWGIGIDLSHPSSDRSYICAALTDPSGNLAKAWLKSHSKSEKIRPDTLRELLTNARTYIREHDQNAKILIIRDGRLTPQEHAETYLNGFSRDTAMIEIRKNGNPIICNLESLSVAESLVSFIVETKTPKTHVVFSCTNPSAKIGFPKTLKFHWEEQWVGSAWTTDHILEVIQAMCSAPGLGLGNHTLPAPIYWADGIAGASDTDLRFRGHVVTKL